MPLMVLVRLKGHCQNSQTGAQGVRTALWVRGVTQLLFLNTKCTNHISLHIQIWCTHDSTRALRNTLKVLILELLTSLHMLGSGLVGLICCDSPYSQTKKIVTYRKSKLRNWMLFFIHAGFALQSKSGHFTQGSQTMETFWYVNCDFWERRANPENDIASEKRPYNLNAFIAWENNYTNDDAHKFFILFLVSLKLLIVSVAFFFGHPLICFIHSWMKIIIMMAILIMTIIMIVVINLIMLGIISITFV